jgi:hypothetical protein
MPVSARWLATLYAEGAQTVGASYQCPAARAARVVLSPCERRESAC